MSQLVFTKNGKVFTDSLITAEQFGKRHDHVMRDIRVRLQKLAEVGEKEWSAANFEKTLYQHSQNKQWYTKYDMTEEAFAIVAMSYITPEAVKRKVRFIEEFKRVQKQTATNTQALSPELQMFKCIFDATAKARLDQIEQAKRLSVKGEEVVASNQI